MLVFRKTKSIKSKTNDEIKKELENQGLKLSGKSPEILKDIYMYFNYVELILRGNNFFIQPCPINICLCHRLV